MHTMYPLIIFDNHPGIYTISYEYNTCTNADYVASRSIILVSTQQSNLTSLSTWYKYCKLRYVKIRINNLVHQKNVLCINISPASNRDHRYYSAYNSPKTPNPYITHVLSFKHKTSLLYLIFTPPPSFLPFHAPSSYCTNHNGQLVG